MGSLYTRAMVVLDPTSTMFCRYGGLHGYDNPAVFTPQAAAMEE